MEPVDLFLGEGRGAHTALKTRILEGEPVLFDNAERLRLKLEIRHVANSLLENGGVLHRITSRNKLHRETEAELASRPRPGEHVFATLQQSLRVGCQGLEPCASKIE
jgi:hypothetical protein